MKDHIAKSMNPTNHALPFFFGGLFSLGRAFGYNCADGILYLKDRGFPDK